jgi:hypothetical protein
MLMLSVLQLFIWLCLTSSGVLSFGLLPKRSVKVVHSTKDHVHISDNDPHNNTKFLDHDYYWKRPDIHTLGNVGIGGSVHAAITPLATKIIDIYAYEGQDAREMVVTNLRRNKKQKGLRIVDLCCGVGISTRALESAFPDSELIIGCVIGLENLLHLIAFLLNNASSTIESTPAPR